MKKISLFLLLIQMTIIMLLLSGCWDYRELDNLSTVTGMAVDKGNKDNYIITADIIVLTSEGGKTSTTSKRIQSQGETILDAIRNMINFSGERLYFGHLVIVIISKDIAEEGLDKVIDWFARDWEVRLTLDFLVSKGKTAEEALPKVSTAGGVRALDIEHMIRAQKGVSKAPHVELNELINKLSEEGVAAVLPSVEVVNNEGTELTTLSGIAVFKKGKLLGFIEGEETKDFLFIVNKIEGGIIVLKKSQGSKEGNVSLEIFRSKTRVKPEYSDGKLLMNISIETEVSIGEIDTTKDFTGEEARKKLVKDIENKMEEDIKKLVEKVQNEYNADIFGFGLKVKKDLPGVWRKLGKDWDSEFRNIDVNVNVKLNIRNTGLLSKPIKVGD